MQDESSRTTGEPPGTRSPWRLLVCLGLLVFAAHAWTLTFPISPEGCGLLATLRERSILGCLTPIPDYPYYRPLWFAYWRLCDVLGAPGGIAHLGPLLLHVGAALLVFDGARRLRFPALHAFGIALLAGLAPGATPGLAWLAAGNKAFTLFFLALATHRVLTSRGLALPLVACALALASSEGGYVAALVLPAAALWRGERKRAAILFVAALALGLLHLALSPQLAAGAGDDRIGSLLSSIRYSFFGWLGSVCENLGRYFCNAIAPVRDAPLLGLGLLLVLLVVAAVRSSRAMLGAGALLVFCNVPASLFPSEMSAHHGYLPAFGSGLLVATALCTLHTRGWIAALVIALLWIPDLVIRQSRWSDYLQHSARVQSSANDVLRDGAPKGGVIVINLPIEYRAFFQLRFGRDAGVNRWPSFTALGNRKEWLLPDDFSWPEGEGVVLEYDGERIHERTWEELAARNRAPLGWLAGEIVPFENPVRAWDEILSRDAPFRSPTLGFARPDDIPASGARTAPEGTVQVHAHELQPDGTVFWDVEFDANEEAWLVLGWVPGFFLPTTQNLWLFYLAQLPWLFDVELRDAAPPHAPRGLRVRSCFGFLPAIRVPKGRGRLHVRMRLRE